MDTQTNNEQDFLARAYALKNVQDAQDLYNEWSPSYNQYLELEGYVFPERAVTTLLKVLSRDTLDHSLNILDAGCGTGLVGAALARSGARNIDGIDISTGMLEVAKKSGNYRSLHETDLTKRIGTGDDTYDIVICVGTLTQGHVGPMVFDEFVRVVKVGGVVVATITDVVWETAGFKDKIDQLVDSNRVELVRTDIVGVTKNTTSGARVLALRKR